MTLAYSSPYLLEDPFRTHDLAVVQWLSHLNVDYGTVAGVVRNNVPIITVIASPDRVFAEAGEVLAQRGWIKGNNEDEINRQLQAQEKTLMPILSVYRTGFSEDKELAGGPKMFYESQFNYRTGKWDAYQWPTLYRADYSIVAWSRYPYEIDHIQAWFETQLNNPGQAQGEALIPVTHPMPVGTINQSMRRTSISDASDLEGAGKVIRRTNMTFSLRMWVYKQAQEYSPVVRVQTTVSESDEDGYASPTVFIPPATSPPAQPSANHFRAPISRNQIPIIWPKLGNAAISLVNAVSAQSYFPEIPGGALECVVNQSTDAILLFKSITEANPFSVVTFKFRYRADAAGVAFVIEQVQADATGIQTVYRDTLVNTQYPGTQWLNYSGAAILTEQAFGAHIEGLGAPATIDLTSLKFNTYVFNPPVAPSAIIVDSLSTIANWTGLPPGKYLLCAGGFGGFTDALDIYAVTSLHYSDTTAANQIVYNPASRPSAVIPFSVQAGDLISLRITSVTSAPPMPTTLCAIPVAV